MVLDAATIVLFSVLSLGGAPSSAGLSDALTVPVQAAATKLWAPKKSSKPQSSSDADEEELLKPKARVVPAASKRSRIKMDPNAQEEEEEEEDEEDGEEDSPPPRRVVKKRYVEEEEEDEAEELLSLFPVLPRKVSFGLGGEAFRRSFGYNTGLQGDKEFPRAGYRLSLETFPLLSLPNPARFLGVGIWYGKEMGSAGLGQMNGSTISYPVSHGRWGFDVRYAIPIGERVVLVPALGYGKVTADLERSMPVAPMSCPNTGVIEPCFGDINASHLNADMHIRVAVSSVIGVSLSGGYRHGLSVARGMGTIAQDAEAKLAGFYVEPGALVLVNNWFAVQASVPIQRYGYTFSAPPGGTAPAYQSATDMYYGVIVGVTVMTPP
jgi:hypothetical protein